MQGSYGTRRELLDGYLDSFFAAWLDYRDRYIPKTYTVAFGKRHNLAAGEFFGDYPDGRLITLVRDPRSWLASAHHHQPELYRDLEHWEASVTASIDLAVKDPDRVFLIPFDRLVADTAATMSVVLDWLGLDMEGVCLEPTFNAMAVHSNSAFQPQRVVDQSALVQSASVDAGAVRLYRYAEKVAWRRFLPRSWRRTFRWPARIAGDLFGRRERLHTINSRSGETD
ncbi:MAG TPA: sulfotransferase [Acidimicrobiia bacterium]|nr:sulfotransferase [Acidimicrobiia bacterium]